VCNSKPKYTKAYLGVHTYTTFLPHPLAANRDTHSHKSATRKGNNDRCHFLRRFCAKAKERKMGQVRGKKSAAAKFSGNKRVRHVGSVNKNGGKGGNVKSLRVRGNQRPSPLHQAHIGNKNAVHT
jgi:hypothetical protein